MSKASTGKSNDNAKATRPCNWAFIVLPRASCWANRSSPHSDGVSRESPLSVCLFHRIKKPLRSFLKAMKKETPHVVSLRIVGRFASKIYQYAGNFVQLTVYNIINMKRVRGNFKSALR